MATFPPVTILVRNIDKSARFYKRALGFDLAWDGLLVGPYGQSLRLVEGPGTTAVGA